MVNSKMRYAILAGAVALAAALPVKAEEIISQRAIANLTNNCYACHGPAGKSPGTIPSISKLSAKRIISDMVDFKSGDQKSTVMGRMAKAYSLTEIEAMAHFIAASNAPAAAK